ALNLRAYVTILGRHHVEVDDIDAGWILLEGAYRAERVGARAARGRPAENKPVDAFMRRDQHGVPARLCQQPLHSADSTLKRIAEGFTTIQHGGTGFACHIEMIGHPRGKFCAARNATEPPAMDFDKRRLFFQHRWLCLLCCKHKLSRLPGAGYARTDRPINSNV